MIRREFARQAGNFEDVDRFPAAGAGVAAGAGAGVDGASLPPGRVPTAVRTAAGSSSPGKR